MFQDLGLYMSSLRKLLALQPRLIYPAHGSLVADGCAWINTYIKHRQAREEQIVQSLGKALEGSRPRSGDEAGEEKVSSSTANCKESLDMASKGFMSSMGLVKLIYKDVGEHLHLAASNNVLLHLKKLEKEGLVQRHSSKSTTTATTTTPTTTTSTTQSQEHNHQGGECHPQEQADAHTDIFWKLISSPTNSSLGSNL